MRRDELILAMLLAALVIAGVVYQEYRGAPKTAEVIVIHRGDASFDAPSVSKPRETTPTPSDASPLVQFLNRANQDELMSLPGVGATIAGRIIAYRERFGPYRRLADLLEVEGIGATRLENIELHVLDRLGGMETPRIAPQAGAQSNTRASASDSSRGKVALNQATREQLMEVTGIGPALADRILAERERRGRQGFGSWDDVDAISGIGPSRLQLLQEKFTVGGR